MYSGLVHLHNVLRWVILLLLVIAIFQHLAGMSKKRSIYDSDRRVDLFLMLAAHIQLVIGVYEWFAGPWGYKLIQTYGMSEVMKQPAFRFWAVEHITGMFIAIVLITIGRGAVKRSSSWTVHRKAFWLFLIALILILAVVPWPFREAIARPWFPGMTL